MQIIKRRLNAMVSAFVTAAVAIQTPLAVFADAPVSANQELPSYYNLVEHGYVSPVRNQNSTGTCWAHSALGAAESSLIMDGLADTDIDLSETHLVWFSLGQNTDPDDPLYGDPLDMGSDCYMRGGSPFWAIGAFAAWIGPVYECNYPSVTELASVDEAYRYDAVFHLQKAVFFDNDDTDAMKKFIIEDGALTVYYRNKKELYKNTSEYTSSYSTNPQHSHAVTIVGWDDNFSKENFVETPPGDGAWIIKNSKGTKFGKEGYFYLSYYDASIDWITGMEFESANNYGKIYQHNITAAPLFGCGDNPITGANVFTASGSDPLAAVSFCAAEDVPYIISIYKGVSSTNPMSGTLMHTQIGITDYQGYHTVKLTKEVNIPSGEKFSVCVALDKPRARIWGDSNAKEKGTSFYTSGIGTPSSKWKDESDGEEPRNFAIKAFTKYTEPVKPANVKATAGVNSVTLKWDKVPGATKYKVCYKNGNKYTVLTSDCKKTTFKATGLKAGKNYDFVVRAYVDGKWSEFSASDLVSAKPKANNA